jgi:hypothetical protein
MNILSTTLKIHLNDLVTNYNGINDKFVKTNLAAEQINSIFDQLFVKQIDMSSEDEWSRSVMKLLFGAHSSWVYSYILTSSGLSESGLMLLRRSIEFTFYLSKIMKDHSKYRLWLNRNDDLESRKRFSNKFSIPKKYFHEKYKNLIPLIVWHDFASTYGVHGNFSTIVSKIVKDEETLEVSFQDSKRKAPISTAVNVRIASLIIDVIVKETKNYIKDADFLKNNYDVLKKMVNDSRVEILSFDTVGKYSNEAVKAIYDDDMSAINEMYEEIKNTV